MTESPIVRTDVRLPAALHSRLAQLAQRERRSLNAQLVVILEQHLAQEASK